MKAKRYDGYLPHVQKLAEKYKEYKPKLESWLQSHRKAVAQGEEMELLKATLPGEIDELLKSGNMDDATIEKLARKRAMLDLLPHRRNIIDEELETLANRAHPTAMFIEEAVRKCGELYFERQLEQAVCDLKTLGASDELAKKQAMQREDIQAAQPVRVSFFCGAPMAEEKAVKLLFAFECFEAGLSPFSPEAAEIKARMCPDA